jgi:hypothetical protein
MATQLGVHSGHRQLHFPQVPDDEPKKNGPYDVRLLALKLRKHDHRDNYESD